MSNNHTQRISAVLVIIFISLLTTATITYFSQIFIQPQHTAGYFNFMTHQPKSENHNSALSESAFQSNRPAASTPKSQTEKNTYIKNELLLKK